MTPKEKFRQALLCDTAKEMRQHLRKLAQPIIESCLLYTSDAADE